METHVTEGENVQTEERGNVARMVDYLIASKSPED